MKTSISLERRDPILSEQVAHLTLQRLQKIISLLKRGFSKQAEARTLDGAPCKYYEACATRWSIDGAISLSVGDNDTDLRSLYCRVYNAITNKTAPVKESLSLLIKANDHEDMTGVIMVARLKKYRDKQWPMDPPQAEQKPHLTLRQRLILRQGARE